MYHQEPQVFILFCCYMFFDSQSAGSHWLTLYKQSMIRFSAKKLLLLKEIFVYLHLGWPISERILPETFIFSPHPLNTWHNDYLYNKNHWSVFVCFRLGNISRLKYLISFPIDSFEVRIMQAFLIITQSGNSFSVYLAFKMNVYTLEESRPVMTVDFNLLHKSKN